MNENSFEENNENFNTKNKNNLNKEEVLSLLEKLKLERDNSITNYSNLLLDFNNLKKECDETKIKLNALEVELINANSKFSFSEQKLQENIQNLFSTEKKLSEMTIKNKSLEKNYSFLEEQLSHYKLIYSDSNSRSEKEINILNSDLEEIKKEKDELFKNNSNDNDHLIKILEESNQIVKTSEAKTLSFDNTINEYKKQINDLNLEIEKLKLEMKMQKEYNSKFKDFFAEKITICDQNFESALNEIRNNLHKKVEDKISEYNRLKADFINAKIERDKYYGEYTILNQDYKNSKEIFQKQYLDIQKEKREKENEMTREIGFLKDKLEALFTDNNKLKTKNAKLESNNKELEQEKKVREKLEMKNKEINEEIGKIKQDKEDLERENEQLKSQIDALLSEK